MTRSIAIAVLVFVTVVALADEEAVAKYRNFTPQQIAEIPEKVRSDNVPMMYILAARSGLSEGSELLFGMQLNGLMYPGVHDYAAAVKAFQRDLGDKPTGVLTVWQIHSLEYRAEMQKLSDVGFPEQFFSYKDDTSAMVTGTFVILDDKIAYPINHTKVMCYRSEQQCRVDQMYLAIPDKDAWAQRFHVFEFDPEYYTVTQWTEDLVDAVPSTPAKGCRTTTLNLNFKTKEFYEIARNVRGDCEVLGVELPKLDKPRISQIVDGKEIIQGEYAKIRQAAFDMLASDFRAKVQRLTADQSKK